MTSRIVDVAADTELFDALSLMEKRGVRRVLVIEGNRLAGILTRANILRGLLASLGNSAIDTSDCGIRLKVLDELAKEMWVTLPRNGVMVRNGIVSFWGEVSSPQERQALRVAAERVPGVKGVEDHTELRNQAAGKAGRGH